LKNNIYFFILYFFIIAFSNSQTYWVIEGWQLFKNAGDARILSLGSAASTDFGTPVSPLFNPSLSSTAINENLSYTHQNRFGGSISSDLIGFTTKKRLNYIFMRESIGDIPDTRNALLDYGLDGMPNTGDIGENNGILDDGERLDSEKVNYFNQNQIGLHISKSFTYNNYNLGLAIKFLDHHIGIQKSHGIGLDFGFLLNNWKSSKISFVLKDITTSWQVWNNGTIERTKPSMVSGFSHSLFFKKYPIVLNGMTDFVINFNGRSLDQDFSFGKNSGYIKYGLNLIYDYKIAVRLGKNNQDSFSIGIGLSWDNISLDYAMINEPSQTNFGTSNIVSLVLDVNWLQKTILNL